MIKSPYKFAIGIEYLGTRFSGWQSQTGLRCVQSEVEKVLSRVADEPIAIICAGRTDTGVHAHSQVVHFETQALRDERSWLLGANTQLPKDIAVTWVKQVGMDFHARFSALSRTYHYQIYNRLARSAVNESRATWIYHPLDVDAMHSAAQALVGEHNFTSFRTAACQAKSPIRTLKSIKLLRQDEWVYCRVTANAFLHHMVRNIMGSLIMVGKGERSEAWLREVLQGRDRTIAGPTARPDGLYLHAVEYSSEFQLPIVENNLLN